MIALLISLTLSAAQVSDPRLDRAEKALAEGRGDLAEEVLRGHDEPAKALAWALGAFRDDPERHWAWSLRAVDRLGAERARGLSGLADPTGLQAWDQARRRAVQELWSWAEARAEEAARRPEQAFVAAWALRLARDLSGESDELATLFEGDRGSLPGPESAQLATVFEALGQRLERSRGEAAWPWARTLTGFDSQRRFARGKEELAEFEPLFERAWERLDKLRSRREQRAPGLSLADALALDPAARNAFTQQHASASDAALVLSPSGRYRIESEAGWEATTTAATLADEVHARLSQWYGQDPFTEMRGEIRVVPDFAGLESEGTPSWWAFGFQRGNRTVVRCNLESARSLGRRLTHELTHRFDGAIYPGLPRWLREARAVWTAAAYEDQSPTFIEDHGRAAWVRAAYEDGYAGQRRLERLIADDLEPQRETELYGASYALYSFLRGWREDGDPDGELVFRSRLQEYLRRADPRREPLEHFEKFFADGVAGRPAGMVAFASQFADFLIGFHPRRPQSWAGWFVDPDLPPDELLREAPNWGWEQVRTAPPAGRAHAERAGELLLEAGSTSAGLRAWCYALAQEGRDGRLERRLARELQSRDRLDAAFAVAHLDARPVDRRAPFLEDLPHTRAFFEACATLAERARSAGAQSTALALQRRGERLSARLQPRSPGERLRRNDRDLTPLPRRLSGFREDELAGYDVRRIPGLGFVDAAGDLHVGRPRGSAVSGVDPLARRRPSFFRAEGWVQPGSWRLETYVQFTTTYASGCVVIARRAPDRDLRFRFAAGDFVAALGEREAEAVFSQIDWSLEGRWLREAALPGARPAGRLRFDGTRSGFDLEIEVQGPAVTVRVDGLELARYAPADGCDVEGQVGFAVDRGALRFQAPRLTRLDDVLTVGSPRVEAGWPSGFADLLGRPAPDLPPGSSVVWVPHRDGDRPGQRAREVSALLRESSGILESPVLVLPFGWESEQGLLGRAAQVLYHRRQECGEGGQTWGLFVDSYGIVRHAQVLAGDRPDAAWLTWQRVGR